MFRNREKRNVRHRATADSSGGYISYGNGQRESLDSLEPPKRPRRWRRRFIRSLVVLLLIAGLVAAALYFYVEQTTLKGEKAGRVNIMVLGVDDAATLSDTIMVVSLSTKSGEPYKVAMTSLPRDLYVDIPEFGGNKINAAYTYGQNNDYPGGGPALSQAVVEDILDLPIHYYIAMDFTGFKKMIDTVGGVDIDVKTAINDPYYPNYTSGYAPLKIAAGPQHMDGERALAFARSRHTTSDFDRAARQQQVALAFREKVLSTGTLTNPARIADIQQALKDHLKTNLSLREMGKLAEISQAVEPGNITRHVIDNTNFLIPSPRSDGSYVPKQGINRWAQIRQFVRDIFTQAANNIPPQQQ